jgi:RimJ/RimL family protein N-acetyltransferase
MSATITTKRLIVRAPEVEDFETIWEMKNDPLVVKYTGGVSKFERRQALEQHMTRCAEFAHSKDKVFSVVLKESNQFIGYCGLKYCEILQGVEILYGFSKVYWGKGYAKEAAKAVLEYGLENISNEIVAAVNPSNVGSERVLKAIGMTYDGDIEWPEQGLVHKYKVSIL